MRLFLAALLVSFNVFAVSWTNLEDGNHYTISQSFELFQTERSGSSLHITKGERVFLDETVPLSMINVTLFIFDYQNCPGPEMTTEMEIIPVQGTNPVVEIGAQLEPNCKLNIFIENRDLFSQSLFQ